MKIPFRNSVLLIILLSGTLTVGAQTAGYAFAGGEELQLAISFRAKMWPNTDMGNVVMTVSEDTVHAQPAYKVEAYARTNVFRWIFKMDDYYTTWLGKSTGLPMKSTSELSEGSYRFSSAFNYNWDSMEVQNRWRNHKRPEDSNKTISLTEGSMDGVALFYRLRSDDIHSYTVGEPRVLELLLEDTVRRIQYTYLGPEVKDVDGLGSLKTLKFSCQIATSEGERFDDGSVFFLWVTDDPNKVPVYLESPIRFGSVRARLTKYKNLKYINDSVLP
jgi:hypothetical protein